MTRLFAALYVSEIWYSFWRDSGNLHAKAMAVVSFDRILTGRENRMLPEGGSLDDLIGKAAA